MQACWLEDFSRDWADEEPDFYGELLITECRGIDSGIPAPMLMDLVLFRSFSEWFSFSLKEISSWLTGFSPAGLEVVWLNQSLASHLTSIALQPPFLSFPAICSLTVSTHSSCPFSGLSISSTLHSSLWLSRKMPKCLVHLWVFLCCHHCRELIHFSFHYRNVSGVLGKNTHQHMKPVCHSESHATELFHEVVWSASQGQEGFQEVLCWEIKAILTCCQWDKDTCDKPDRI